MKTRIPGRAVLAAAAALVLAVTLTAARGAGAVGPAGSAAQPSLAAAQAGGQLTAAQRHTLLGYARDTWKFFGAAVDQKTHLPMDNIGFNGAPQGPYTSPTDIGVYFWSVISARDLGLISAGDELHLLSATLDEVQKLEKWNGFLLSWYDTGTGQAITGPGGGPISGLDGQFISTVDNGWYGAGLIEVRQSVPALAQQATALLNAMDYGVFYDNGDESTNVNAGQMYGGYTVGTGPATFEYGMLYSETRIAAYLGMGTGQMPGDVWWRTWRTEPAQFGQRQVPAGSQTTVTDPLSGKQFGVFEGHYSYDGIDFVPSWGGDVFEGLMDDLVVPETQVAPQGFGANDEDYTEATIAYDTKALGFGVWGLSPSSTPDDTGNYLAYGSQLLGSDPNPDYAQTTVTPHASFLALNVLPQQAFANIQRMRSMFPQIYGPDGFYDALDPVTGAVGHRYLDLDQSMIMAALDDVLNNRVLSERWSHDPVGKVDLRYLRAEKFSVAPEH
jgi:hypothetical protein